MCKTLKDGRTLGLPAGSKKNKKSEKMNMKHTREKKLISNVINKYNIKDLVKDLSFIGTNTKTLQRMTLQRRFGSSLT